MVESVYFNFIVVFVCVILESVHSQCPAGWQHHGESCYLLHYQDKFDWIESQMICAGHKAHLAHVEDEAENIFIKGLITQHLSGVSDAHVWLGAMDDVVEGQFLWYGTDLPVTFTDWGPGEPNSVPLNLREDCLVYWAGYSWQWADFECHQQCYFICEKGVSDIGEVVG